jgi:hypothetical protein
MNESLMVSGSEKKSSVSFVNAGHHRCPFDELVCEVVPGRRFRPLRRFALESVSRRCLTREIAAVDVDGADVAGAVVVERAIAVLRSSALVDGACIHETAAAPSMVADCDVVAVAAEEVRTPPVDHFSEIVLALTLVASKMVVEAEVAVLNPRPHMLVDQLSGV